MERNITQLYRARAGEITDEMKIVAEEEYISEETVRDEIARGRMIITANVNHKRLHPIAIGLKTRCKINANIGNSELNSNIEKEKAKLDTAVKYGADTVMDLSTGGDLNKIRRALIEHSRVPLGTVPVYQVIAELDSISKMTDDEILRVITQQAEQGVDFITIHSGILFKHLHLIEKRVAGIVSRGGSLLACWMLEHNKENPFYTLFDDICKICAKHDVSLSLGDGMRPGALADASDEAQFAELEALGELTMRAREMGVQAMVEGPGHVPFDQIAMNMQKQQEICDGAPFYVLGPLVTDISPGYDHISSSIGATMAAFSGASMLCYVTPKEHLGLPEDEDVRQGVIAYKIAAHAADIALKKPHARDRDDDLSRARFDFDWDRQFELALDPDRARTMYDKSLPEGEHKKADYCSMCGPKFCAYRTTHRIKKLSRDKNKK